MFKIMSDIREKATGRVGSVIYDEALTPVAGKIGVTWADEEDRPLHFVDPNTLEQAEYGAALPDGGHSRRI
jgi:hypothetical protein